MAVQYHAPPDLDRELHRLIERLPGPFDGWLRTLNNAPASRRIPAGIGLIAGGVFSFLPILGVWMLPLGVVLLAKDIPPLRRPSARMLAWAQNKLPPEKPKT